MLRERMLSRERKRIDSDGEIADGDCGQMGDKLRMYNNKHTEMVRRVNNSTSFWLLDLAKNS